MAHGTGEQMSFHTLGLEPRILEGVSAMGYTDPTPIQTQAIPLILGGRDVVGVAQTGTGKTAAFVLPMLQRTPTRSGVRALVVTPTRELALQISEVVGDASRRTGHRYAVVYGGVGIHPQIQKLRRGVDVLVACPGRLLDLHSRGAVDLSRVETLVLDEADRMLDMGFWPDVRRILGLLPERRQNLLFSATMSPGVLKVVESTLHDPVRVEVSPSATPVERIGQTLYPVCRTQKTDLLVELLKRRDHTRTLVFTRTKHRADRLSRQLERQGVPSAAIHGGRSQAQRQRALDAFKAGRSPVLVATDVVARGIDVDEISHVVNYDMPNTAEDYVHRIGRTARAGASGSAISFLSAEEVEVLRDIEKTLGSTIACEDLEGFRYVSRHVPDPERTVVSAGASKTSVGGAPRSGNGRSGRRGGKGRAGRRS
jgi:ATP-dependent RNA helicase RhlE